MAQLVNPTAGITDAMSGGLDKFFPPAPLPVPVTRSFLFEIIDISTSLIMESFALVIPPNAVSMREPQRVNVTKTFGNIFVDDYGPDNPQIVIKGWSGTSHAFPTFTPAAFANQQFAFLMQTQAEMQAKLPGAGYNHQQAFFAFRDSIIRYKYNYSNTYQGMKLRVYDLNDAQSYDCILMEFNCDREASRPLYYPYTIVLLVYAMPDVISYAGSDFINVGGLLDDIINAINTGMSWVEGAFAFASAIVSMANTITNTMAVVSKQVQGVVNKTGAALVSPLGNIKSLISSVASFKAIADAAYANGWMVKSQYCGLKEMIQDTWRQSIRLYGQAITTSKQNSTTIYIQNDAGVSTPTTAPVGTIPNTSRAAIVNNFTYVNIYSYTVRVTDTLQSIAQSELGDASLWPYIARLNSLINNLELQQRQRIFLPSQIASTNKDAFIVSEREDRDPYGTDIMLDKDGNFIFSANDFVLISGISNIIQWVNMTMKTKRGALIKHTTLGITAAIGDPGTTQALGYLVPSIKTALQSDPRIKKVSNIIADIDADKIPITMNITPVNSNANIPASLTL